MSMLFRARYAFKSETTEPNTEQAGSIQYKALSNDSAVKGFVRWWENRHEAVPEYFQTLYAVKIYSIYPQVINESGYLPSETQVLYIFEWKYDWPWAKTTWEKLKEKSYES